MQRTRIVSLLLAGLFVLALGVSAQQPIPQEPEQQPGEPPSTPPPAEQHQEQPDPAFPEPAAEVTDEDLDTFANIYMGLMETAERFEQEIAEAETVEEIQEAQERMRDDSIDAIEAEGWTLDKYNSIAQAINADPQLAQQALRRIEEKEAES